MWCKQKKLKVLKKLRFFCLFCTVFMTIPAGAYGKVMYINDNLEITVRGGKGVEYKILAIAKANDRVELLGTDGKYANVRLGNGIEGWVLSRYLTDKIPKPIVIENLRAEIKMLKEKNKLIRKEFQSLQQKRTSLESKNMSQSKEIEDLKHKYEKLKTSCANFIQLKNLHEKLKDEFKKSNFEIIRLKQKNQQLQNYNNLLWFIAGVTTLLVGLIIGLIIQNLRFKRKKSISF